MKSKTHLITITLSLVLLFILSTIIYNKYFNGSNQDVVKKCLIKRISRDSAIYMDTLNKWIEIDTSSPKRLEFKLKFKGEYSYDIEKTDSLVSPYVGKVNYKIYLYTNNEFMGEQELKAIYAYQDNKWIVNDVKRYIGTSLLGPTESMWKEMLN